MAECVISAGRDRWPLMVAARRGQLRDNPWLTLVSVALGVIMVGIDGSVVAVANPYIGRDLHASLADLQWVTNAYLLVIAVTLILGGKLGDRFGRRRVFLIGVVGFSLTSVAIGLAGTIDEVIILRGVQGAFGALLLPNTLALLKAAFPPHELNRAVGIWVSATAAATAAGPIIGGFFVEHISWQSVFFINLPIGAIALAVGAVVLNETKESVRQRFDVPGVVTLALGLLAIVYGLVNAQNWGWGSRSTPGLVVIGLVLLAVFVAVERVVRSPLVPLSIFRVRAVSVSTIIVLLDFFALFGVLFFISLYLQSVHGFSPVGAGLRLLPLTIAFAVAGPLGARLVNRFGPWLPITFGLLVSSIAIFSFVTLQVDSSYIHLWPPFVLLGLGIGLVVTSATDAIVGDVPEDEAGVAGGIQTTSIQLGGVLGTAVCGSILAASVTSTLGAALTARGVPRSLAHQLLRQGAVVSQGLAPVPRGAAKKLAEAITNGSHAAFMAGLHTTMLVAGFVALAGAALGPLLRPQHEIREEDSDDAPAEIGSAPRPMPRRLPYRSRRPHAARGRNSLTCAPAP
ncbi:MAG TPA: MFS transporter [Acidimicrobiales bacterium]|nr:MFS transporter [Acidimicrobiales bacterium]